MFLRTYLSYLSLSKVHIHVFTTGYYCLIHSSKSFLFSLYNINGYAPVKLNMKSSHYSGATASGIGFGPTFGTGSDLYISNNAGSNSNSFTHCGVSYPLPTGYFASGSSCRFYAGSYKFTLTDVEVFYQTTIFKLVM